MRNDQVDDGRKGSGTSKGKKVQSYQMDAPPPRGRWFPAYGGGMGESYTTLDPDCGTPQSEVGGGGDAI